VETSDFVASSFLAITRPAMQQQQQRGRPRFVTADAENLFGFVDRIIVPNKRLVSTVVSSGAESIYKKFKKG
jgi:hypothetical protein